MNAQHGPGIDPTISGTGSTNRFPFPTTPNKSLDTLMVEDELGDRPRDICIAHERQCAVIEDEPLIVDPDCHDSMIFVREAIPQHDNLHGILWESCCEQR